MSEERVSGNKSIGTVWSSGPHGIGVSLWRTFSSCDERLTGGPCEGGDEFVSACFVVVGGVFDGTGRSATVLHLLRNLRFLKLI